jgi:hypothetical protein
MNTIQNRIILTNLNFSLFSDIYNVKNALIFLYHVSKCKVLGFSIL